MVDVYATISEQPEELLQRLVEAMDLRAEEPEMKAMMARYLAEIDMPDNSSVLEIGCGAGAATKTFLEHPNVAHLTGVDPSPIFLERARAACEDKDRVSFIEGDARDLQFDENTFDVVVSHTVLSHVPEPEAALKEALRVLKPGGQIVIFDGDYATINLAIGDNDPLQSCADSAIANFVHDPWFIRRLPKMLKSAGFTNQRSTGHGYVKITDPQYLLTISDRGAEAIAASETIGSDLVAALKAEARRRVEEGLFYGLIMFAAIVAEKPS